MRKQNKTNIKKAASAAQKVVNAFPSFDELMNDPKYMAHKVLNPLQYYAFQKSQQWEGIAMAANNMCHGMFGRELYGSYSFSKSGKGYAQVYPAHGDAIEVGFDDFCAIIKSIFVINMGTNSLTEKQVNLYDKWRYNDSSICKIMD